MERHFVVILLVLTPTTERRSDFVMEVSFIIFAVAFSRISINIFRSYAALVEKNFKHPKFSMSSTKNSSQTAIQRDTVKITEW